MSSIAQSAVLYCDSDPQQSYCYPRNVTPVTQPNEVITVYGKPANYVNYISTIFQFTSQPFYYIPSGLLNIFPNMTYFYMDKCSVTTLLTDSLLTCAKLTTLVIRGGNYTEIPAGVVQSCKSLQSLEISNGLAKTVHPDAFLGLTNLTYLSISYNKITCLPSTLLQNLPSLTAFMSSDNLITAVDSNMFVNLPKLTSIGLFNNSISSIPKFNFPPLKINTFISVHTNPITAFSPDICTYTNASVFFFKVNCIANYSINSFSPSDCLVIKSKYPSCFVNWTSAMNTPPPCGVQSCPSSEAYSKMLDFLRSIAAQIDAFLKSI